MFDGLKHWAATMKRDVLALYLAGRDPRVPCYAKVLAAATAAYALSPIDLIPDFIPIIGYLDDLILIPAAIWLTIKLIPNGLMAELRNEAALRLASKRPPHLLAARVILAMWFGILLLAVWLLLSG